MTKEEAEYYIKIVNNYDLHRMCVRCIITTNNIFISTKGKIILMRKYEKWNKLHNLIGDIILDHFLFGRQIYKCNSIQVVNDEEKIGVIIKKKELFVYKQKVVDFCVEGNTYIVGDDALKIKVICK